jgi:hypothetical protein
MNVRGTPVRGIAESDWNLLRQLKPLALDRLCQRILSEVGQLTSADAASSHDHFLAVFDLIELRNSELAVAFDDLRRSNAILKLACMRSHQLITDEEFGAFSQQTREAIEAYLGVWMG